MKALTSLMAAMAVCTAGMTATAQADDTFVSLSYGLTSDKIRKSGLLERNTSHLNTDGIIRKNGTWGVRAGQMNKDGRTYVTYDNVSSKHSGIKLRRENLLGSHDAFLPIGDTTNLFGGVTLGVSKLSQESPGTRRDTGYGYAAGLQAGVLQKISDDTSVEFGYRYLRSNASTEVGAHGGPKTGSLRTSATSQTYVAASYNF